MVPLNPNEFQTNGCLEEAQFDALKPSAKCPISMLACKLYQSNTVSYATLKSECDYFSKLESVSCPVDESETAAPTGAAVTLLSTQVATEPLPAAVDQFCTLVRDKMFPTSEILRKAVFCTKNEVKDVHRRSLLANPWEIAATVLAAFGNMAESEIAKVDKKTLQQDIFAAVKAIPGFENATELAAPFAATLAPSSSPTEVPSPAATVPSAADVPSVAADPTPADPTAAPTAKAIFSSATTFLPSMIALLSYVLLL